MLGPADTVVSKKCVVLSLMNLQSSGRTDIKESPKNICLQTLVSVIKEKQRLSWKEKTGELI